MLTLSEFKIDLGLTEEDTTQDKALQNFINRATARINSETDRVLIAQTNIDFISINQDYQRRYYGGYYNACQTSIYLSQYPINSIASIEKLTGDGVTYESIFNDGDNVSNSVIIVPNRAGQIILRNGYTFNSNIYYKITYNAGYVFSPLTGTVSTQKGQSSVVGTDTLFTTELIVGSQIIVENEIRIVSAIADNTHLTVSSPFIDQYIDVTFYISNVPEDLRNCCLYYAMDLYYTSPVGKGRFGLNTVNIGGQSSNGESYKNQLTDLRTIIQDYKKMLI